MKEKEKEKKAQLHVSYDIQVHTVLDEHAHNVTRALTASRVKRRVSILVDNEIWMCRIKKQINKRE